MAVKALLRSIIPAVAPAGHGLAELLILQDVYKAVAGVQQFSDADFTITKYSWSSVSSIAIAQRPNYAYLTITGNGYWFQSDYDGNSNKWLPVGIKDQAGATAHVFDYCPLYWSGSDRFLSSQTYSVCPDDTYFLNCYWNDLQSY